MLTPSAVSTSAEPDFDDSARLPCLATGTPQPATTSALAVEMLKLPEESPPVPQVSIVPGGASICTALARMIRAAPAISSTVSPRTRNAIRKPPICDGVASPLMMMSNAASASLSLRLRPCATSASSDLRSTGRHSCVSFRGHRAEKIINSQPQRSSPAIEHSYISPRRRTERCVRTAAKSSLRSRLMVVGQSRDYRLVSTFGHQPRYAGPMRTI